MPAIVADAGDQAIRRFVEFFTATIRNPNTRQAYARAARDFFAWIAVTEPAEVGVREPESLRA